MRIDSNLQYETYGTDFSNTMTDSSLFESPKIAFTINRMDSTPLGTHPKLIPTPIKLIPHPQKHNQNRL